MKKPNKQFAYILILILALIMGYISYVSDYTPEAVDYTAQNVDNTAQNVDNTAHNIDNAAQNYDSLQETETEYSFRNSKLLNEHYNKHGKDMGFESASDYEKAASNVINNPDALSKTEAEDGDYVYYIESTNEFVVLSTDGYIRTYFLPDSGKRYYDKQ